MKGRILIVDDDSGHLTMLNTVLSSLGHTVERAIDGEEAIRAARANPYDLILMDVRMSNVDGIEALQQIKAVNPSIPIIIMTAYSSVDKAVAAMKLGAYDYLTKSLNFDALKITLDRAMNHLRLSLENQELKKILVSENSFTDMKKEPLQEPTRDVTACSTRRTRGRSFWMKSVKCSFPCR